ncbi:hypothetical protein [Pseudomonas moorei]|uniref:hypothetical protein n=1 Tax=Pseudomonas moorei TaxID=395599 RepID=UPI0011145C0C|nr:hypothetical protein [Pseudomonas moorei]KAB0506749.1 hypothetical protein F7R06_09050 [Pseudomonas moorei]
MPQVIVSLGVRLMIAPVLSSYCRAALIEPENTSTVLELYTRFLKCFVSATAMLEIMSICTRNGSIESPTTTQNAGCTMAIHANCTEE